MHVITSHLICLTRFNIQLPSPCFRVRQLLLPFTLQNLMYRAAITAHVSMS